MSPTIRIDEDVWSALQKRAHPFVDTPNDVLRRILNLDRHRARQSGNGAAPHPRLRRGERTPEEAYYSPVLAAVAELGGRGRVDQILDLVGKAMAASFRPPDYEELSTGTPRWRNSAQWARNTMCRMKPALLNPGAPRGWWEITEAGRRYLSKR
jgi:hypothetical protein